MLDAITQWIQTNEQYALWLVPCIAFAEAIIGIGMFVSGAILVAVCSLLYAEGIATLPQMLPLAFIGAASSDHLGFYLGKWVGPGFHNSAFAKKRAVGLAKAEKLIRDYGWGAILIGRLVTAIRSFIPLLTGISGFSAWRYTAFDLLACTIWTSGLGLIVLGVDKAFG